jgi:D-threonate/D-erythronate kinase
MRILADDLTSAIDAVAPFADRGVDVSVRLNEKLRTTPRAIQSIDLDTRFDLPDVAQTRVCRAASDVDRNCLLLKTVDSTLRGNVAAEVIGALRGSRRRRAVVAPAFPQAGRTTVGGHQFVGGVPVERTPFGDDPRTPVTTGNLAMLFAGAGDVLIDIRDAKTDADLDAIVASVKDPAEVVWVGSPGLAAALARRHCDAMSLAERMASAPAQRMLVVVGSAHPANREQIAELARRDWRTLTVGQMSDERLVHSLLNALLTDTHACLMLPEARQAEPGVLIKRLGDIVAQVGDMADAIVATGGETLRSIMVALKVDELQVTGEIEPGVPFGIAHMSQRRIGFAAKAGGFGSATTLLHAVDLLGLNQREVAR